MIKNIESCNHDEEKIIGTPTKVGFHDKSGAYPKREYWNSSDSNFRARGLNPTENKFSRSKLLSRAESTKPQVSQESIIDPTTTYISQYPYNKVTETVSGHIIEVDDTPGSERLRVVHNTGSKVEIYPNGDMILHSQGNRYSLVTGNDSCIIRGTVNIVVESSANIRVQGDCITQVDGSDKRLVQGDYSLEVQGNYTCRVHGNKTERTTGARVNETRGSVLDRHLSNYACWNVGTYKVEIGDNAFFSTEKKYTLISNDECNIECEGGYIELKNGYVRAENLYSDNLNVQTEIKTESLHTETGYASTWHGALEGTAKRASWATTAGSAPLGASSPVTASPTSPEDPEEPDNTNLMATEVAGEPSTNFILDLDRKPVNGDKNSRRLNAYEVTSRCRNKKMLYDSRWLEDQVKTKAILKSITSSSGKSPSRTSLNKSTTSGPVNKLGSLSEPLTSINLEGNSKKRLPITEIPIDFKLSSNISSSSQLSPHFKLSHFLAGDSWAAAFQNQMGLSQKQVAENLQLVAFNICEKIYDKYFDRWTISEGLYTLLPNEKIDSSSLALPLSQGLGVGIQMKDMNNSEYYDIALWCQSHLTYDKLVLSYIDYDPSGINEPTLLITIKNGVNLGEVYTEWNHKKILSGLGDYS